MYWRTGSQPVPPHSTGQCGTAQPLALRMRVHSTSSSFEAWCPCTSLSRMRAGSAVRKNSRTSSRKAFSSGVKRRSMGSSFSYAGSSSRRLPHPRLLALLLDELLLGELADGGAGEGVADLEGGGHLVAPELVGEERAQR